MLEDCIPEIEVSRAGDGNVRFSWPSNTPHWLLEETTDYTIWEPSFEIPFVEGDQNVLEIPAGDVPNRGFRLRL